RDTCPEVFLHGQLLPQREEHIYLGLVLDKKLTFASHIKKTRAKLENTARRLNWLTCPKSKLSLSCKTRLYQSLLAPIWYYGKAINGTVARTHLKKIQVFQAKFLRRITGAQWYLRNADIRKELKVPAIGDYVNTLAARHRTTLWSHPNALDRRMGRTSTRRRLKRVIIRELPTRRINEFLI
ncbi:hypothetical protein KR032_005822, partial [Drosophila birchii]